jgi:hypothetical protein
MNLLRPTVCPMPIGGRLPWDRVLTAPGELDHRHRAGGGTDELLRHASEQ